MIFTFSLVIIITILSYFLYKPIHKYKYVFYVIAFIIALILREDGNYITYGYTGLSFFIVVMFSGVLDKSTLRKRLFMVRAELAILGTIFLFPHALGYLDIVLEEVGLLNAPINFFFGFLSGVVIVPLFITSFTFIRKRMKYKEWKQLHQLAYLAYIAIGLHLILINNDRQLMYIILFGSYFVLKSIMLVQKRIETNKKMKLKKNIN